MGGPDADPQVPPDMATLAVAAHEYFTSLRNAGFRVHEALYLTAALLTGGVKPPAE
jgi:hypothetical protein